jgi:hypothetical protein
MGIVEFVGGNGLEMGTQDLGLGKADKAWVRMIKSLELPVT